MTTCFFTSIISSVDEVLDAAGYSTLVCICHSDVEREGRKLDFLRRKKIDGLIAVPCSAASDFVRNLGRTAGGAYLPYVGDRLVLLRYVGQCFRRVRSGGVADFRRT